MAVKAVFQITDISIVGGSSDFYVSGKYVYIDTSGNQGPISNIGPFTPGILSATFELNVIAAVKNALSIGTLDTVRLLGSTLI